MLPPLLQQRLRDPITNELSLAKWRALLKSLEFSNSRVLKKRGEGSHKATKCLLTLSICTSKEVRTDKFFIISCFERSTERQKLYDHLKKLMNLVVSYFERSIDKGFMISCFERSTERQKLYDLLLRKKFQSIIKIDIKSI